MKIKLTAAVIIAMSLYCVSSGVVPSPIIPTQINYQGVLKNPAGQMITDPSLSIVFSIYSGSLGGVPLWTETQTVSVESGSYNVQLGSVTAIPADGTVFDGSTRYLGIKVGSDLEMTPLLPLVSIPYAYVANRLDGYPAATTGSGSFIPIANGGKLSPNIIPKNVTVESATNIGGIGSERIAQVGYSNWINGQSTNELYGIAVNNTKATNGTAIQGVTSGTLGTGVYGYAMNSDASSSNIGVWGDSNGGAGIGVYGKSTAAGGIGVRGWNFGSSEPAYGGYFVSNNGIGLYGKGASYGMSAEATDAYGCAVYGRGGGLGGTFRAYSPGSTGVLVVVEDGTTGITVGGNFHAPCTAVVGYATSTDTVNYAIQGNTASNKGYSGYFSGGRGIALNSCVAAETGTEEGTIRYDSSAKHFYGYIGAGGWKQLDQ